MGMRKLFFTHQFILVLSQQSNIFFKSALCSLPNKLGFILMNGMEVLQHMKNCDQTEIRITEPQHTKRRLHHSTEEVS